MAPGTALKSRGYATEVGRRPFLHLQTLLYIRWIAFAGQLLAVLAVWPNFQTEGQRFLVLIVVAMLPVVNLYLMARRHWRLHNYKTPSDWNAVPWALQQFLFDLMQLALLLSLTGGIENPFALIMLVPVILGATILPRRPMIILLIASGTVMTIFTHFSMPLPWADRSELFLPRHYRFAIWAALMLGMTFSASIVWRISHELRLRQEFLTESQIALERERRISALGSLAAAAAHGLAGPLGTILLIAKRLKDELGGDPDYGEDIVLLGQEARRGRDILTDIAGRIDAPEPMVQTSLEALLREAAQSHGSHDVSIRYGSSPVITVERRLELLLALSNVIGNAIGHAKSLVSIDYRQEGEWINLHICDDGSGFSLEQLKRLEEGRLGDLAVSSVSGESDGGERNGLGIGLFIATTLLHRIGAVIVFGNRVDAAGAEVTIRWKSEGSA